MDLVVHIISYFIYSALKEVKGLTNKLYTYALAWKKTGLHSKFRVHRCFDMDLVVHIISYLKEVKGLTNKLYTYALAWKKTSLHTKFHVHSCFDNVLSGQIISYLKKSKRVNKLIICLCTSLEENRFTCKSCG